MFVFNSSSTKKVFIVSTVLFIFLMSQWFFQTHVCLAQDVKVLLIDNTYGGDPGLENDIKLIEKEFSHVHMAQTVESGLDMIRHIGKTNKINQLVFLGHGAPGCAEFGKQVIDRNKLSKIRDLAYEKGDSSLLDAFAENAEIIFYNCQAGDDPDFLRNAADAFLAFSGGTVYAQNDYVYSDAWLPSRIIIQLYGKGLLPTIFARYFSEHTKVSIVPYTRFQAYNLDPFELRGLKPGDVDLNGPGVCAVDMDNKGALISPIELDIEVPSQWKSSRYAPFVEYELSKWIEKGISKRKVRQIIETGVNKIGFKIKEEDKDIQTYFLRVFLSNGIGRRLLGEARHSVDFYAVDIQLPEEKPKSGEVITARARCVKGTPPKDSLWNWKTTGDLQILTRGEGTKNDEKQIKITGKGEVTATLYRIGDFGKEKILAVARKEIKPDEAAEPAPSPTPTPTSSPTSEPQVFEVDPEVKAAIAAKDWKRLIELNKKYVANLSKNEARFQHKTITKALEEIARERKEWLGQAEGYLDAQLKANNATYDEFRKEVIKKHTRITPTGAEEITGCPGGGGTLENCLKETSLQHLRENERIRKAKSDVYQTYHSLGKSDLTRGPIKMLQIIERTAQRCKLPYPYPSPVLAPIVYKSACYTSKPVTSKALTVELVPSKRGILRVGETVTVKAVIRNAKKEDSPFTYSWSGDHAGKGDTVTFMSSSPGKKSLDLNLTSATGKKVAASIEFEIGAGAHDMLIISKVSPAGQKIPLGAPVQFSVSLSPDARKPASKLTYRWQASIDTTFKPQESTSSQTTAHFQRPDTVKVWVVALEEKDGILCTFGESNQLELKVEKTKLSIVFTPEQANPGQEVTAKIEVKPEIKEIDFRWELPENAKLIKESQDCRQIIFSLQDTKPATIITRARVPHYGDDLGEAKGTIQATAFAVSVKVLGPMGPPPVVWVEGKGQVEKPGEIAVSQNVKLAAEITPAPGADIRYQWFPNEGTNISNTITREITAQRSEVGTATLTVVVKDAAGVELGRGSGSFEVTISQEAITQGAQNKKKAEELKKKAESLISQGKPEEAEQVIGELEKVDATAAEKLKQRLSDEYLRHGWEACRRDYNYEKGLKNIERAVALAPSSKEAPEKYELARKAEPMVKEMKRLGNECRALLTQKKLFSAIEVLNRISRIDNQEMPAELGGHNPEKSGLIELCGKSETEYNAYMRDYRATYSLLAGAKQWEKAKKRVIEAMQWEHSAATTKDLQSALQQVEYHLGLQKKAWDFYGGVKTAFDRGDYRGDFSKAKTNSSKLKDSLQYFPCEDERYREVAGLAEALLKQKPAVVPDKPVTMQPGNVREDGYRVFTYPQGAEAGYWLFMDNHTLQGYTDPLGRPVWQGTWKECPQGLDCHISHQGSTSRFLVQMGQDKNSFDAFEKDSGGNIVKFRTGKKLKLKEVASSPLKVSMSASNTEPKIGEELKIKAEVSGGTPPYKYEWYIDGKKKESLTSTSVASTSKSISAQFRNTGNRSVQVVITDRAENTRSAHCSINVRAQVAATPKPLRVSIDPPKASITIGGNVSLHAMAEGGTPPYRYDWFHHGKVANIHNSGIKYTLNSPGRRTINVVVYDSVGNKAEGVCWITVSSSQATTPQSTASSPQPTPSPSGNTVWITNLPVYVKPSPTKQPTQSAVSGGVIFTNKSSREIQFFFARSDMTACSKVRYLMPNTEITVNVASSCSVIPAMVIVADRMGRTLSSKSINFRKAGRLRIIFTGAGINVYSDSAPPKVQNTSSDR